MKKLRFILQSDGVDNINRCINYYINENIIKFKIDNDLYEYNLEKDILKKKNDTIILMDFLSLNFIITLKETNMSFDIPIYNVLIKKEDKCIEISYDIEEDKMTNKRIIIEY